MSAVVLVVSLPDNFEFKEDDFIDDMKEIGCYGNLDWFKKISKFLKESIVSGCCERCDNQYFSIMVGVILTKYSRYVIKKIYFGGWTDGIIFLSKDDISKYYFNLV